MRSRLSLVMLLCALACSFRAAGAEELPQPQETATAPAEAEPVLLEKGELFGKRPEIRGTFLVPVKPGTVTILLDGSDMTQLVTVAGDSFRFTPPLLLRSGDHNLSISMTDAAGNQVTRDLRFTSRHTTYFEEAYSNNIVSSDLETLLVQNQSPNTPDVKVETNLQSESRIKRGDFEASLAASLRHFDQNRPLPQFADSGGSPLEKGLSLMNYLFTARQRYREGMLQAEIGNVVINETPNTVMNLQRRGGRGVASWQGLSVAGFSVKGENVVGFRGGTGLSGDLSRNIAGVSGALALWEQKIAVKTVYAEGGEPGNSIGIAGTGGGKEGNVLGFNLLTDFWANRLRTDFEYDRTRFDPDTSDDIGKRVSHAWRFRADGAMGSYTYDAGYEYFGRDYASIGNLMQQKDREIYSLRGGSVFGAHMVNAGFSRSNDNVKNDPLLTRTVSYAGNIDYSFSGIPSLPMGLGFQKSSQTTGHAESGVSADIDTDALNARMGYAADFFNLNLLGGWSRQDDRTAAGRDSTTINVSLSPGFRLPQIAITPTFSLTRNTQQPTDVTADNYTITLDVRSRFFKERLAADGAATYNISRTDDHTMDMRSFSVQARIAYSLADYLGEYIKPAIALRGTYQKTIDLISHAADQETGAVFLVLSAAVPFMF